MNCVEQYFLNLTAVLSHFSTFKKNIPKVFVTGALSSRVNLEWFARKILKDLQNLVNIFLWTPFTWNPIFTFMKQALHLCLCTLKKKLSQVQNWINSLEQQLLINVQSIKKYQP